MPTWTTTDAANSTMTILKGTYRPFTAPVRYVELPILASSDVTAIASVLQHVGRGRAVCSFEARSTSIGHYNGLLTHQKAGHAGTFKDTAGSSEGCIIYSLGPPEWVRPSFIRYGVTLMEASTS